MENNFNKNLIRIEAWFNPLYAEVNGNFYELNNIILYSDFGDFYESGCGWFRPQTGSDNPIKKGDGLTIKPNIKKVNNNNIEKNKKGHNNFIINTTKYYSNDKQYTLYIYYKNINCQFLGFDLSNFWLESTFNIFDNFKISNVLGSRTKQSDKIRYNEELKKIIENITLYNIFDNEEKFLQNIKTIKKYYNKYKKIKEEEKAYTIKDYKKMIYQNENFDGLKNIEILESTFNFNIND